MEFQNGKIYTIRSSQTDKYYIGSTNQKTLAQRLGKHRSNYNDYLKDNTKGYITSFEILQYNDYYIELLELFPCNTKAELHQREGQLQRQFKNEMVNKVISGRTYKENKEECKERDAITNKAYRDSHKQEIAISQKKYTESHKEEIKAYTELHKEEKKAYDKLHKEQIKAYKKAYKESHKEQIAIQNKKYKELHKEEIAIKNKARNQAKKLVA